MPPEPAVPTVWMTAVSALADAFWTTTVWPADRLVTLFTFTLVSPALDAAASVVAPIDRSTMDVLFSSTVLATPTLPTSQPARVNGTHGAGALRTEPFPPSEAGSALTMLKFGSADGVCGLLAGFPPSVLSVQYLNVDEKPAEPSGRK